MEALIFLFCLFIFCAFMFVLRRNKIAEYFDRIDKLHDEDEPETNDYIDVEEIQAQQKRDSYNRQFYIDYLKSEKWMYKKLERYLIDKGLCQECHEHVEFEKSHCHHKTYANLFNEPMDDLETLHAHCHINIRHAGKNSQS